MRLTDASVEIRPRSNWEALDLGVLMARQHAGLLMASWALVTLPVFALLSLLLWQHPGWAAFIFWWLKPAFERLPLHILSRTLFSQRPKLSESVKGFAKLLKPQLLASLTWRRLQPARSFNLPVQQLEGLKGAAYRQRLASLSASSNGSAFWLTISGFMIEGVLYFACIGILYLLIPNQLLEQFQWQKLLNPNDSDNLIIAHLTNLLYALVLIIWEPIYVACGFSLYLNRRSTVEAWDIELNFRRLRQRISGSAYLMLLAAGLAFSLQSPPAQAVEAVEPPPSFEARYYSRAYLDESKELFAEPRLTQQPLSADQAQQSVRDILSQPPFYHTQLITDWRFKFKPDRPIAEDAEPAYESFESLFQLLSNGVRIILWALLICAVALLIWRYREWISAVAARVGLPRLQRKTPNTLFGLDVAPESLPSDVASDAERLWPNNPRLALSLLYRALLSKLLHQYQLPLKSAHTEGEVLLLLATLEQPQLSQYSASLTRHWQKLAYGHQVPALTVCAELCNGWRQLFIEGDA